MDKFPLGLLKIDELEPEALAGEAFWLTAEDIKAHSDWNGNYAIVQNVQRAGLGEHMVNYPTMVEYDPSYFDLEREDGWAFEAKVLKHSHADGGHAVLVHITEWRRDDG